LPLSYVYLGDPVECDQLVGQDFHLRQCFVADNQDSRLVVVDTDLEGCYGTVVAAVVVDKAVPVAVDVIEQAVEERVVVSDEAVLKVVVEGVVVVRWVDH
jgi:hypothetical protein